MNQILAQLIAFFQRYPVKQRIIIVAVLIGFISSIVALVMWANRPEYALLYSNLEPEAANTIVSDLRNSKVPFRLEDGGTSIFVPKKDAAELRLKYVQSGSVKGAVTGYEIFDKNNIGMTTFMERLNLRRALEGELTRTINQFPGVQYSRVHLVVPERKLFEQEKKGSASVVLHLQPGVQMASKQLSGIASLVANSVEGLTTDDVVILNSDGRLLADKPKESGVIGDVGNQWELRNAIESQMQHKVTELVESVVGYQNAIVKVSADLNFDQVEKTVEAVDPDNVAVLSEERYTERSNSGEDSSNFNAEKVTSNYELTKKKERFVSNTGNIKRLTVAVLVNGKYTEKNGAGENTAKQYVPRTKKELDQIATLVKTAVGFSQERGDMVEVQNIQFNQTSTLESDQKYFDTMIRQDYWQKIITYGLVGLGLLIAFFMLRTFLKSGLSNLSLPALPPLPKRASGSSQLAAGQEEEEIPEDIYIKKLSPEARAQLKAKNKMTTEVVRFTQDAPEDATKLIRSWLMQERPQ